MFPLASFLHVLEEDGFRLTVRDYDRIALVLATDGDWTLARLRSVLRTLLARNRDQQDLFERRFDEFFAELPEAPLEGLTVDPDIISRKLEQLRPGKRQVFPRRPPNVAHPQPRRTEKKQAWFRIGLLLCALLSVLAVILWPAPLYEQDIPLEAQSTAEEVVEPEAGTDLDNLPRFIVSPRRPFIASRESTPLVGDQAWKKSVLIAGILLLLCLAYAWYLYQAQKVPKDKPAHWKNDPALPRLFPLDRVGGKPAPRLDRETLAHLADCLGYFQGELLGREPDILRSVAATAEHAGLPVLIFPQKKQLRRLIILVNHTDSEALRLNPLAEELRAGMAGLGVQLLCGRYYDDPAVFYPEDGRPRFLVDYESERNGYLLLIFSSHGEVDRERHGHTLEGLARWPHIAWMQLRTDGFQQNSTVTTNYGIASYPASKTGLLAAFTRFLTETGSRQETGSGARQRASLRGDTDVHILVETRLADALPWAQACAMLQPTPLGLADCLRRAFFAQLPPERIERLMDLPGTSLGKGGFSFSQAVGEVLRQGFFTRFAEARQKAIFQAILAELEKTKDKELGDCAEIKASLAYLAWQKQYQLVNLQLEPEQALKGLAELEGTPFELTLKANVEDVDPTPLVKKIGNDKDALQRIARLFGKRSGLSLLKRYPLSWLQWTGAAVLVLSLLITSGLSMQGWLGAGQGEARLSVLAESGGGNGWVGVEESGTSPGKRSGTEGLLRLPVETRLPLRKNWQLVFYDHTLQPAHTVELGRISENQLIRLGYEEAEQQVKTGELVVTNKQRNVLRDAEVTLRSSLVTVTARADRILVLPVGEYEVQMENNKGIGAAWQKITVSNDAKKVAELEPTWYRDSLKDGGFGPAMVSIEGGSFRMGDIQGQGEDDEKPMHEVRVDSFALGRYEVTVGEFRAFIEQSGYQPKDNSGCWVDQNKTGDWKEVETAGWDNPFFAQSDEQPVVCVSWEDATAYAQWLSEETGQQYRLPTEAEWEYAARAGTETARYWGDNADDACGFANVGDAGLALYYPGKKKDWEFHECLDGWTYTAPAGSLKTNSFFLHDMLGNAWEWTGDWYDEKYYAARPAKGSVNNPQGPKEGVNRVIRGGGWYSTPADVRSAYRDGSVPANRDVIVGFRLARTNPQPSGPFTLAPAKVEQQEKADPSPTLAEPEMVPLKGGSFQMGDIQGGGDSDERPVHEVNLSPFAMGKYEVTNAEYVRFLNQVKKRGTKERPWFETEKEDSFSKIQGEVGKFTVKTGYEQHPVVNVSWYGAVAYADWLSSATGKNYRLPTEAEWEFAARAGTTTARHWGNDISCDRAMYENDVGSSEDSCVDYVRKKGLIPDSTAPVGSYSPNKFDLHDMLGNAWEWTADWYDEKYYAAIPAKGPVTNPQGPKQGVNRVIRGGSWYSSPASVRSAFRLRNDPANRYGFVGFRLARTM